jgi:Transposase, Mutator family
MQAPSEVRNATTVSKAATAVLAAVFAIAMTSFASLAASDFVGTWNVKDTAGQPFEITLSGDGTAKAISQAHRLGREEHRGDLDLFPAAAGAQEAYEADQHAQRLNEEIRRRTYGVRIFPNARSCLRLVRALCVETYEAWLEAHIYLNMQLLTEHKKETRRQAA